VAHLCLVQQVDQPQPPQLPQVRGLHSSTFRLNVSACCEIGGAFRVCLGVFKRCQGVSEDI